MTKQQLAEIRKAVTAFLIPVVPAVGAIVKAGTVTKDSAWLLALAVLSGLGVWRVPNKEPKPVPAAGPDDLLP